MDTRKYRPRLRVLSVITSIALFALALITISLSTTASNVIHQNAASSYSWETQQISDRIQDNVNSYAAPLYSGQSLLVINPNISQSDWVSFFNSQDTFHRYPGINSINYVQLVPASEKNAFQAQKRLDPNFGSDYTVYPPSSGDTYALATLVASATNMRPNGFDVYSTPDRRAVYTNASQTGQIAASPQLELSTGVPGMFVTFPVSQNGTLTGFVNEVLHSTDFFPAIVNPSQLGDISLRITDVTDPKNQTQLYTAGDWTSPTSGQVRSDSIAFADRTWKIDYRSNATVAETLSENALPRAILLSGILLICVLLMSSYIIFRTAPGPKRSKKGVGGQDIDNDLE